MWGGAVAIGTWTITSSGSHYPERKRERVTYWFIGVGDWRGWSHRDAGDGDGWRAGCHGDRFGRGVWHFRCLAHRGLLVCTILALFKLLCMHKTGERERGKGECPFFPQRCPIIIPKWGVLFAVFVVGSCTVVAVPGQTGYQPVPEKAHSLQRSSGISSELVSDLYTHTHKHTHTHFLFL